MTEYYDGDNTPTSTISLTFYCSYFKEGGQLLSALKSWEDRFTNQVAEVRVVRVDRLFATDVSGV